MVEALMNTGTPAGDVYVVILGLFQRTNPRSHKIRRDAKGSRTEDTLFPWRTMPS